MRTPSTNTTLRRLRAIGPTRPVQPWEARQVAETQASRLRAALGADQAYFDTDLVAQLPRLSIETAADLEASGSTTWSDGAWRIRLNSTEALVRQRFTVAHELKHVIDAPHGSRLYSGIRGRVDGEEQIEAICDYFAACLLMPKRWVKQLWGQGNQDLNALAGAFDVSTVAMKRRLEHLGLTSRTLRHRTQHSRPDRSARFRPRYFRTRPAVFATKEAT